MTMDKDADAGVERNLNVEVPPRTYRGPYGVYRGCPSTKRSITLGIAMDAGFTNSFSTVARAEAYAGFMVQIANVIYSDQINVVVKLNNLRAYTTTANGPRFNEGIHSLLTYFSIY